MSALELVVGIDFGTTHSGVSWAVNGGTKTVRLINDWPNPKSSNLTHEKVPSVISYRDGNTHAWGYNAGVQNKQDGAFCWFKLLLDPGHKYSNSIQPLQRSKALLEQLGITAQDVVSDYLRSIWEFTKEDIRRVKGDDWTKVYAPRVVLTVPAIWSHAAKEKTEKAARMAGLPPDIRLVTEPEAAALAVLRDAAVEEDIKAGDAFVVCDAGGGTVDLISYEVKSIRPLQIEECAIGNGDLCGSVFVDDAFEKWVKLAVGEQQYEKINPRWRLKMMQDFEGVKRSFSGDDNEREYSVDLRDVEDNEREGIVDETILLKPELLKTTFEHACGKIVRLVDGQIREVEEKGLSVKAVLLVGGFGASRYLHKRLEGSCKGRGMQVLQMNQAWSSICRGATLWGLENSTLLSCTRKTVASRIARYSYGYIADPIFDETKHHMFERYRDSRGKFRATNQVFWLVKRGTKIKEGTELTASIIQTTKVEKWNTGTRKFTKALVFCAEQIPPTRNNDSVKQLCSVDFTIGCRKLAKEESHKDPSTKEKWRDITFAFKIITGNANLKFDVLYRDEVAASCEAQYVEDM